MEEIQKNKIFAKQKLIMQNSTEEEKLVKDTSMEEIKEVSGNNLEETKATSNGETEKKEEESPLPESDQVIRECRPKSPANALLNFECQGTNFECQGTD